MCLHHDLGVLGAAYDSTAQRRRFELLKEAGVNAIRTSHNEMDPDFLDLCDELGLLVKDETFDVWTMLKHTNDYSTIYADWSERDMRAWVRQDRNHPSVIMWSLGNEITEAEKDIDAYVREAARLAAFVRAEDPTRPVTGITKAPRKGADVEKPFGEWNAMEIELKGGTLVNRVNGVELNRLTGIAVPAGAIALQSEGGAVQFRNIWIEEFDSGAKAAVETPKDAGTER